MTARMDRLASSLGMNLENPAERRILENFAESRALLKRLIAMRRERGYTQEQFAELLGISQSAVAKMETGDRDPRLSTLIRYAMGLDVVLGHTIDGRPARQETHESALEEAVLKKLGDLVEDDPMDNVVSIEKYRGVEVSERIKVAL